MQPIKERRAFGRRNVESAAWIVVPGRPRTPCLIDNLSAKGAFLKCVPPKWLPFRFHIHIEGEPSARVCETRHVLSQGLGVYFCEPEEASKIPTSTPQIDQVDSWCGHGGPPARKFSLANQR